MKQMLINVDDNRPKSGKLAIALYPNTLRKSNGLTTSYYARVVNRRTLGMDDIFNDILSEDPALDTAVMRKNWNTVLNAIAMRLTSGISVDFGLGTLSPTVSGSFDSAQSEFNRSRHRISVQFRPSDGMRQTMEALEPVIMQGNSVRPEVMRVCDCGSGWDSTDIKEGQTLERGTLTAGNLLIVEGKMLCIAGDSRDVGLYFDCVSDPASSVKLGAADLCRNRPSVLECIVPGELKSREEYRIRVVTQYLYGNKRRESSLSFTFPSVFSLKGMGD